VLTGLAAVALIATGLAIAPQAAPQAWAAGVSVQGKLDTGGWKNIGNPDGTSTPVQLAATTAGVVGTNPAIPFTPIDDQTLYFASNYGTGVVGYFATGGAAPVPNQQKLIGYGRNVNTIQGNPMSTMAVDADPNNERGEKYAYFWAFDSNNSVTAIANGGTIVPLGTFPVVRWAEGSTDGQFLLAPNVSYSGFPNQGGAQYWSGGEVVQKTGQILFGGAECNTIDGAYNMMLFDPNTYAYNFSGQLKPATPGDDIFDQGIAATCGGNGYVASDMALDANGNAYLQVVSTQAAPMFGLEAASRVWLVRVVPHGDGKSWTYNLVTPLSAAPGQSIAATQYANGGNVSYGSAFYQGMLYVAEYAYGGNLLQINPMSGYIYTLPNGAAAPDVPTMGPVANYVLDMASGQTAWVIQGTVYNDANANGAIDSGEVGVAGQTVALYMKNPSGQYVLEGVRHTDASGGYAFLVSGKNDYLVRLVRPSIDGVNAVQTWAGGGGVHNPVTARCINGDVTSTDGGACYGALPMPAIDPALPGDPAALGTDTSTQPDAMPIYSIVSVTSDQEVANADFGITATGSFGDAVDAGTSTLTLDKPSAQVGTPITATATIKDADGNPLFRVLVSFSNATPTDVTLSANACTSGTDGTCSIIVTSAKAGTYANEVSATVTVNGTDTALAGSPADVAFTHGGISQAASTFTLAPQADPADASQAGWAVADGASSYTGTLTAKDADGDLIADLDPGVIDFGSSGSDVHISGVTNHGDGTYSVAYTSTVADSTPTASVTVDAIQVGLNAPIPFKAGPADAAHSTLVVTPSSLLVTAKATVDVVVADANGNLVSGVAVDFGVTGSAVLSSTTCTTDADGACRTPVRLSDAMAEQVTVSANVGGGAIAPVTVEFTAIPATGGTVQRDAAFGVVAAVALVLCAGLVGVATRHRHSDDGPT